MVAHTHSFLELLTEREAVSAGFNLSERNNFTVYQTIKKLSTNQAAQANQLYNLDSHQQVDSRLDQSMVKRVLKNLVSAKIVAQIFTFEYKRIEGEDVLKVIPCFIAHSNIKKESPHNLYNTVIDAITNTIDNYINAIPSPDFEQIWSDMGHDLNRNEDKEFVQKSILDFKKIINIKHFNIIPSPEMIHASLEKIKETLAVNDLIVELPKYGMIPIRESSYIERFEAAETFFVEKLIPVYLSTEGLKPVLEKVAQEEAIYYLDNEEPRTTKFTRQKVDRTIELICKKNEREDATYPGELCLQILQTFSDRVNQYYSDIWKKQIDVLLAELVEPLLNRKSHWKMQVSYISKDVENKIHKIVWERFKNHPDLIFGEWEQKDATITIVIRRDKELMKTLVREMSYLPPWEFWKILSIRQILEDNDDFFQPLFKNTDFKRNYGKILRIVYVQHIPFFYRICMMFGLTIFQHKSFQIAKQKIQNHQDRLRVKNTQKQHEELKEKESIRFRKIDKVKNISRVNAIINKLDQYYFTRKIIPSIIEIQNSLNDIKVDDWLEYLRQNRFQIIKSGSFEKQETSILCFPQDSQWAGKRKQLDTLLKDIVDTDPQVNGSDLEDVVFQRAQRLQKYLSKSRQTKKSPSINVDSYMIFEQELKKRKEKDILAAGPIIPDKVEF